MIETDQRKTDAKLHHSVQVDYPDAVTLLLPHSVTLSTSQEEDQSLSTADGNYDFVSNQVFESRRPMTNDNIQEGLGDKLAYYTQEQEEEGINAYLRDDDDFAPTSQPIDGILLGLLQLLGLRVVSLLVITQLNNFDIVGVVDYATPGQVSPVVLENSLLLCYFEVLLDDENCERFSLLDEETQPHSSLTAPHSSLTNGELCSLSTRIYFTMGLTIFAGQEILQFGEQFAGATDLSHLFTSSLPYTSDWELLRRDYLHLAPEKTLVRSHPGSMVAIGRVWYGLYCGKRRFNYVCEDDLRTQI